MVSPIKFLLSGLLAINALTVSAQPVDTLAKLRASKAVTMGVRDSSAPLSYSLGGGNYAGYHVELCKKVLEELIPGIKIAYSVVTSLNRIPLIRNGTIDIECGSTTNTDGRQREAAFAVTTFIAEVRMAVKKQSGIESVAQLEGKRLVTTAGGTGVTLLRKQARAKNVKYDVIYAPDHSESFLMLESDRADAFVLDDNVLAGLIAQSKSPQDYVIVGETLSVDPNAIMLPKDDTAFKAAVDGIIQRMMKNGELETLYKKWFMAPIPPRGVVVNLPMGNALRNAFSEPNTRSSEEMNK